jgi:luciferase family oxidoreductase group 1
LGYFVSDADPQRIVAMPGQGDAPAVWLLGSSGYSAQLAGLLGLPFSFAHHLSPGDTLPALALYRQSFRPSRWLREPYVMVAVSAVCADTDEYARYLAGPSLLSSLRLPQDRREPLRSPREAASHIYTDAERELVAQRLNGQAQGSPQTVEAQLTDLLARAAADELMLTTMVYDIDDRIRSFELIATMMAR